MKHKKKLLSTAITLSLVLGVYGVAGAANGLYGATSGSQYLDVNGAATTAENAAVVAETGSYVKTGTLNDSNYIKDSDNKFEVKAGTWGTICGGKSTNNTVTISGGTVSLFYGAYSNNSIVSNNTVNISGGTVGGGYYWGDQYYDYNSYGGYSYGKSSTVSNNTVNISGGSVGGNVYGGYAYKKGTTTLTAINNTVNISGTADVSNASLYGYYTSGTHEGNTLNIAAGWTGSVKSIQNFDTVTNNGTLILAEKSANIGALTSTGTLGFKAVGNEATSAKISGTLNFYIPATAKSGDTMLTVAGDADISGATINVVTSGYTLGTKVNLLSWSSIITDVNIKYQINGKEGRNATIDVDIAGMTNLQATVGYDEYVEVFDTQSISLKGDSDVTGSVNLAKSLDLNDKTINMQQDASATATYNTLTVAKLTGTGSLAIDVDLSESVKNDKISITGTGSDASLNLSSVLVRGDGLTDGDNANAVTYVEAAPDSDISGITYKVNGSDSGSLQSATTDYIYTFTKGDAGKLNVAKEAAVLKVADFVQGINKYANVGDLDINKDTAVTEALGTTFTDAAATGRTKELTLGIDAGKTLSAENKVDGITVADGYTLHVKGETSGESVATMTGFGTALTNNAGGTLNVSDLTMTGNTTDIVNNGTATLASVVANTMTNNSTLQSEGDTTLGSVTGTGTTEVKSGTTTVTSGFTQNGLTVDSGASFEQNGGSFVVNGDVTNNGSVTLKDLGGSADPAKATNKVTGTLTNNDTFTLNNTNLVVGSLVGNAVVAKGQSALYIANAGTINANVLSVDTQIAADGFAKSNVGLLKDATIVVGNAGSTPLAIANNNDVAFAKENQVKSGENAKVVLNEGAIVGQTDFVYDAAGNRTIHEKPNQHNASMLGALADSLSFARMEMNDIRKRLGDVRINNAKNGMWARYENGKNEGSGVDQSFNKFQIGGDTAVSDIWRLGGTISYTKGSSDYAVGSTDTRTISGAVYGVMTGRKGEYLDLIARVGVDKHDINAKLAKGDLNNLSVAVSAEVGKTYDFAKNFFVEPQVELTYTRTNGDDFNYDGRNYKLDDSNSFIGRLGFALGYKAPNNRGTIYTRFSVLHEFAGDKDLTVSNNTLVLSRTTENDGSGSWLEWAIGGQIKTSKATYFYADIEKTFNADINEKYRLNVGMRYSF